MSFRFYSVTFTLKYMFLSPCVPSPALEDGACFLAPHPLPAHLILLKSHRCPETLILPVTTLPLPSLYSEAPSSRHSCSYSLEALPLPPTCPSTYPLQGRGGTRNFHTSCFPVSDTQQSLNQLSVIVMFMTYIFSQQLKGNGLGLTFPCRVIKP